MLVKRTITYSLQGNQHDSDLYYEIISHYADVWTKKYLPIFEAIINDFRIYRRKKNYEDRSSVACLFDLQAFAVLLFKHGAEASILSEVHQNLFRGLIELQERCSQGKGFVKFLRGLLYGATNLSCKEKPFHTPRLELLSTWLQAIGDVTVYKRLREWLDYFRENSLTEAITKQLLIFAKEFDHESTEVLGRFTQNVEIYLKTEAPHRRWRYDGSLLGRSRLEYHLGMLGTEILNRANRATFLKCHEKIIILPPCMRSQPQENCMASATPLGETCCGCTPSCRIHQITKLGEKYGFRVYMIPDELRVLSSTRNGGLGVIGVSCVLTNWTGGWDADSYKIPAQGVLLDYVGCRYHWDKIGFPTDVNTRQLLACLGLLSLRSKTG